MRNTTWRSLPLAAPALFLLVVGCHNGGGTSPTEPPALTGVSSSLTVDGGDTGPTGAVRPDRGRAALLATGAIEGLAGDGASAPDSPEIAAARGGKPGGNGNGNGNRGGNGNGNGNGGNDGGRGNGGGGALALQIQPDTWNVNWEHAEGTVSALIRGGDAADVDRESVEMLCEGGEVLEPVRVQLGGGQLRAFFAKSDAIACLDDPDPREVHEVTLAFTVDGGEAQELTANVRIVGPAGGGDDEDDTADEVRAQVQPNTWNVNWVHAQGTVSILLTGDVTDIDVETLVLVGSAGTEVQPASVKRAGNHVRARFPMDEAFLSLDDPDSGETHEIKVKFADEAAATHELTLRVRIVGPR